MFSLLLKELIFEFYSKRFLWNLQQMGKVIRPFCWHQNFVPWGLSAPAPGLYICFKSWKKMYKIRLQRHLFETWTNEWSDKTFLLTSKLCSPGAVCPCPGAIYMYKIMKTLYKIRLQRDVFETCNKWPKWQDVPDDIKILFPRGCQPLPRGYIHAKNHEKKIIKSDFKEIFLNLVAHDQSDKRFLLTSTFYPLGSSAPDLQLLHLLNHEKMCINSEVEEILFKFATNDHSDEASLLTLKFWT